MAPKPSKPRRTGAAAVEAAIILPLLALLVLGCVDFGRFLYHHIALQNAVRAGAAYACMNNYTVNEEPTWKINVQEAARDEMTNQTGYIREKLTVVSTTVADEEGLRRIRVFGSLPFQTIVNWPGIPDNMALRAAIEIRAIR